MSLAQQTLRAGALVLALSACNNKSQASPGRDAPAVSASAVPASSAQVAAKPAEKPWFVGDFSGSYQAELAAPKSEVGAPRQWQKDDGKAAVGPGTLSLSIAEDGAVGGSAQGAFGEETLSGKLEGDVVRASLTGAGDTAFRGTLIAARNGNGFKGSIQASSGDSNTVRAATLELTRKP